MPAKYSYLVAENEAESPWQPLHVERGFAAEHSTVHVIGAKCPHNVNDHESLSAKGILTAIAGAVIDATNPCYEAQPVVVFGPRHRGAGRPLKNGREKVSAGARNPRWANSRRKTSSAGCT